MRDPGGAIVALAKPPAPPADIAWYQLQTNDVDAAKTHYAELFGWAMAAPLDLGELGVIHPFAWAQGGAPVGAMMDVSARQDMHPHWLFHFRAPTFDAAIEAVRRGGGTVLLLTLPSGEPRRHLRRSAGRGVRAALSADSQTANLEGQGGR